MRIISQISRFWTVKVLLTTVVSFSASTSVLGQSDEIRKDLAASFRKVDVVRISSQLAQNGQTKLAFVTEGDPVEIALEPHDIRAASYRAEDSGLHAATATDRGSVTTFKGMVNGDPGSFARFNIRAGNLEGFFTLRGERYFLEAGTNYSVAAKPDEYIVYRAEDSIVSWSFTCSSKLLEKLEYGSSLASQAAPRYANGLKHLELATDADLEYVNQLGGASQANAEILGILNVLDGIYSDQLHVSITVVFQHTWSNADPYVGADPEALTRSFQAYWNSNYPLTSVSRDVAHLFSGKSQFQGTGWAFIGPLCRDPSSAYGMSGYISWAYGRYLITAHEMGHNLGANHVDAAQDCADTIMNPSLSGNTSLAFCSYSRTEVAAFLTANGSCVTPRSTFQFDFDNDGRTDIAVYRPSEGMWYFNCSTTGFNAIRWGNSTDKIIPADYDGDGKTDIAVWRSSDNDTGSYFFILNSNGFTMSAYLWGLKSDRPMPGDFDGDGRADIVVYRPASGVWWILQSATNSVRAEQFGAADDVPLVVDNDGDGKDHISVYRPVDQIWFIARPTGNPAQNFDVVRWGLSSDIFVPADYDGDGRDDVAVFRPETGMWYIVRSSDGGYIMVQFGLKGDIPVPGDYDNDGRSDIAVYRAGIWYISASTSGFLAQRFGLSDDQPVPAAYNR